MDETVATMVCSKHGHKLEPRYNELKGASDLMSGGDAVDYLSSHTDLAELMEKARATSKIYLGDICTVCGFIQHVGGKDVE